MKPAARHLSVLMVDDDAAIGEMYGIALRLAGLDVVLAGDGDQGVAIALATHPDIVVLDIELPRRSGLDVLADLKTHSELADVPVLMFSNACQEMRAQALKLGAVACAVKVETTPSALAESLLHWAGHPATRQHA